MPRELILDSTQARGATTWDAAVLTRELTGVEARIALLVGSTPLFSSSRGGKQGGAGAPIEWNALSQH
eukprot:7414565-Pyramimonas_sp.AAC.1